MTKKDKRLQRIKQNPKAVSFDDLQQVMLAAGFELKHITGSHHTFHVKIGDRLEILVVPLNRPHIKAVYVKRVVALIEAKLAESSGDEESHESEVEDDDK